MGLGHRDMGLLRLMGASTASISARSLRIVTADGFFLDRPNGRSQ